MDCFAFDWPPKDNDALFADMISYAKGFRDQSKGTEAEKILSNFIAKAEKKFSTDKLAWVLDTYAVCARLEQLYPPVVDDGSIPAMMRRNILKLIDYPVHLDNLSPYATQAVKDMFILSRDKYRDSAAAAAVNWLKNTHPEAEELAVFKVYNMGLLFRTSRCTIGVDLCVSAGDAICKAIAREVDFLFITHPHKDHYTDAVVKAFVRQEKKIIMPYDLAPYYRSAEKVVLWDNLIEPLECGGVEIRMLAGHQDTGCHAAMPNNVYHITLDSWRIVHAGDNADRELQKRLAEMPAPDVAVGASWNHPQQLQDAIKGCPDWTLEKTLFIPSHENEFGHRVQQRESYWEDFNRVDRYANPDYQYFPMEFMDIGEGILLMKRPSY